jgi:hypothetical protein
VGATVPEIIDSSDDFGELFQFQVGKPEGKRPVGRPRRRWIDNIKMDFYRQDWVMWI